MDTEDLGTVGQMMALGDQYIQDQDETDDSSDIATMQQAMGLLAQLASSEAGETEPAEPDDE